MVCDWTGTSPQVKGAINNTLSFTRAATYTCIKSVLPHDILCNAGFYRPIEVIAPPATIANSVPPAACAARGLTGFRMIDTVFGALAQMLPDRVIAASEGGNTGVSIGGYHADRSPFIFVEFICSAWGGRPWADGLDGNANLFANMSLPSAEVTETEQPLEILCCELMPDVGGPGKHRGRHVGAASLSAARRRGGPSGARRPARLPSRTASTAAGRASRRTTSCARRPGARAHRQGDDDADAPGRRLRPRAAGRGRLGRPARARPGAGPARRAEAARERGGGPRPTTAWSSTRWRSPSTRPPPSGCGPNSARREAGPTPPSSAAEPPEPDPARGSRRP